MVCVLLMCVHMAEIEPQTDIRKECVTSDVDVKLTRETDSALHSINVIIHFPIIIVLKSQLNDVECCVSGNEWIYKPRVYIKSASCSNILRCYILNGKWL